MAIASSVVWTSPALSQGTQQAQAPQQEQQQGAPISEDQLRSYAVAAAEVQRISAQVQPRIQAAGTEAQKRQIQQQALDQMAQAVREEGMSVQEYNEITQQVQTDPQLSQRVQNYLKSDQ